MKTIKIFYNRGDKDLINEDLIEQYTNSKRFAEDFKTLVKKKPHAGMILI